MDCSLVLKNIMTSIIQLSNYIDNACIHVNWERQRGLYIITIRIIICLKDGAHQFVTRESMKWVGNAWAEV